MNRNINLLGLATQFGEALGGNRGELHSVMGRWNFKDESEPSKATSAEDAMLDECCPVSYSTVTDLARLRGLSTSVPRATAV